MADAEQNGTSVELSTNSNGQSSQANLVEGRKRAKKPRVNRSDQAESSLNNVNNQPREQIEEESAEVKYSAAHVIHLFVPVSLSMLAVIISMQSIGYFTRSDGVYLLYTPFIKKTENTGELVLFSIGNALTLLTVVVFMTVLLIVLYKFRFYKVIHGWLIMSTVMLLGLFTAVYLEELFKNYNLAIDILTFGFIIWNFAALGMICVHWKGPHRLQQGYLVIMSALMALIFIKHLPEWSVWSVLAGLAIWDLVAVLCPKGPLRVLVETAQERNEPIFPALVYSSTVVYPYVLAVGSNDPDDDKRELTTNEQTSSHVDQPAQIQPLTAQGQRIAPLRGQSQNNSSAMLIDTANNIDSEANEQRMNARQTINNQPQFHHEEEERGIKLGLGDFIFYSVLVGKASSYGDWNTAIASYVAILIGLSCTLMLLALFRKALPALPISIFFGIIFYFSTRLLITPFVTQVSMNQYML